MTAERMTEAHLDGAAELERACFSEPWSRHALELLLTDEAIGYACVENDSVIAYGGMLIGPFEGQITNVAVHPNHRRRGLGLAVVEALVREARERGLEQISLEVRTSNEAAIRLYERIGFSVAGVRRNFYRKPTEDACVMLLSLQ